jgi:hypothetical protein
VTDTRGGTAIFDSTAAATTAGTDLRGPATGTCATTAGTDWRGTATGTCATTAGTDWRGTANFATTDGTGC